MGGRNFENIKCTVCTIAALVIFTAGCNRDECSGFSSRCVGDVHQECHNDDDAVYTLSDSPNELTETDCTNFGATCIEEELDGDSVVYCGYTEKTCPEGYNNSLCIGDLVGFCDSDIYTFPTAWENSLNCVELDWSCMEAASENGDIDAICTYVTEPCDPDEMAICHDDAEFGNNVLGCNNGVWVPSLCYDSQSCCIVTNTGFPSCVNFDAQDELCD